MVERLRAGKTPAEWLEIFRQHPPDHPWERAWDVTRELILAVAARAHDLGARLLLVVIPASNQVEVNALTYQHGFDIEQQGGASFPQGLDLNLPERRVAALGRATAIDVRLLLEPLRAAVARGGRTHYLEPDSGRLAWAAATQSSLLLPVCSDARVVVEGWLPSHSALPSSWTLEVPGLGRAQGPLEAPGPFRAELVLPAVETARRSTPVLVSFSRTFHPAPGDWREFGAILTGAGLR